jgi:hypothetical protein
MTCACGQEVERQVTAAGRWVLHNSDGTSHLLTCARLDTWLARASVQTQEEQLFLVRRRARAAMVPDTCRRESNRRAAHRWRYCHACWRPKPPDTVCDAARWEPRHIYVRLTPEQQAALLPLPGFFDYKASVFGLRGRALGAFERGEGGTDA